jgi:hypothetical protein
VLSNFRIVENAASFWNGSEANPLQRNKLNFSIAAKPFPFKVFFN